MNREEKRKVIEEIKSNLQKIDKTNLLFLDFKSTKGTEIAELRKSFKEEGIFYKVIKTDFLRIASQETGVKVGENIFKGPLAIAIQSGDPSLFAKRFVTLKTSEDKPLFEVRGGFIEGKWYQGEEIIRISELPSKGVLISQLLYLIKSPLSRLVTVLKKPEADFVGILNQIGSKKEQFAQNV